MSQSSSPDIFESFEALMKARKLTPDAAKAVLVEGVTAALERKYGRGARVEVSINPAERRLEITRLRTVVDGAAGELDQATQIALAEAQEIDPTFQVGDEMVEPINPQTLGRYASHAGRSTVRHTTRTRLRTELLDRWQARVGQMVHMTIQHVDRGTAYGVIAGEADLEVLLPRREQDSARPPVEGKAIEVAVVEVVESTHAVRLVVSEGGPAYVLAAIRARVEPGVWGQIEIVNAVREPGRATKIVARGRSVTVDALSLLAGPNGRTLNRVAEEVGERIDLITPTDDLFTLAAYALAPAEVTSVREEADGSLVATVPDGLARRDAIGERGHNVRLAGRLVGREIRVEAPGDGPRERGRGGERGA